jgi:hypothetical protein
VYAFGFLSTVCTPKPAAIFLHAAGGLREIASLGKYAKQIRAVRKQCKFVLFYHILMTLFVQHVSDISQLFSSFQVEYEWQHYGALFWPVVL